MAKLPINGSRQVGDGPTEWYLDGKPVTEAEFRKVFPLPEDQPGAIFGGTPLSGWPMKSLSFAVHPDQVAEGNARNRQHGVNVEYEPGTGKAIVPDAATKRRLLKLEKWHDRDAYS